MHIAINAPCNCLTFCSKMFSHVCHSTGINDDDKKKALLECFAFNFNRCFGRLILILSSHAKTYFFLYLDFYIFANWRLTFHYLRTHTNVNWLMLKILCRVLIFIIYLLGAYDVARLTHQLIDGFLMCLFAQIAEA